MKKVARPPIVSIIPTSRYAQDRSPASTKILSSVCSNRSRQYTAVSMDLNLYRNRATHDGLVSSPDSASITEDKVRVARRRRHSIDAGVTGLRDGSFIRPVEDSGVSEANVREMEPRIEFPCHVGNNDTFATTLSPKLSHRLCHHFYASLLSTIPTPSLLPLRLHILFLCHRSHAITTSRLHCLRHRSHTLPSPFILPLRYILRISSIFIFFHALQYHERQPDEPFLSCRWRVRIMHIPSQAFP